MGTLPLRLPLKYIDRKDPVLRVEVYGFRPGECIPRHFHEFIELVYVAHGQGTHYYEGHATAISPGHVLLIAQNADHAYRSSLDDPLEVVNVLCGQTLWTETRKGFASVPTPVQWDGRGFVAPTVPVVSRWIVEEHLAVLLRELTDRRLGYETVIKARLCELLVVLQRGWAETLEERASSIAECLAFVHRHAHEPLTIDQLARMASMSRAGFTAKFREVTGTSLIVYRNAVRVERAQALLRETDAPVSTIARGVGFADPASFYRLFRTHTGISPQVYRRRVRGVSDSP